MNMKNVAKVVAKTAMAVMLVVMLTVLTGCQVKTGNRIVEGLDVQTFNYAYVRLGDKDIVEGYVTQWRDYTNSDTVQVQIDGKFYLTHYSCVVLIADPKNGALQYGSGANN